MALNTNPFVEGIDPTATFGGYASVLLQLIRQAQPSSTYGMILFDTTAPDVTGANAWRKRCLWLDLTVPNLPTVNVYKEGGSPGWVNVQAIIPANTITTAMIQNAAVTLAKLSTSGGAANQLIRVNATATAFEFVSLSSLVVNGSINVGSLITTGIPAGQFRLVGTYGPGVANWYTAQNVIDNLANAAISTDLIATAPAATSRSQFLTTRTGDPFSTWRYFDPSVDILAASVNGDRLIANTVPVSKVIPAASEAVLATYGGVVDWIPIPPTVTKYVSADVALPAASATPVVFTHGLAGIPTNYRAVLHCDAPDAGWIRGDEIDLSDVIGSNGAAGEIPVFAVHVNAANISVYCSIPASAGFSLYSLNKGTGAIAALTYAKWHVKVYASYIP